MELRQLKIFVTVAEERSFTRAAQVLGYAQSNITAQVRQLEGEFQTRLFERLGKKIALTVEGELLLLHARSLLRQASEIKDMMTSASEPNGLLTIGIAESLCLFKLPSLLKEYSLRYPRVKLVIRQGTPTEFHTWLRTNRADVVFSLDQVVGEKDMAARVLCEEPMIMVGSPDHPLAGRGSMELGDIGQESFIFAEQGCSYRSAMERKLSEQAIKPASSYEFDSIDAIKQFVQSGLGIALLPCAAVARELAAGSLVDLNLTGDKIEMYTQIIYHKDKWISPALAALLELVDEHF